MPPSLGSYKCSLCKLKIPNVRFAGFISMTTNHVFCAQCWMNNRTKCQVMLGASAFAVPKWQGVYAQRPSFQKNPNQPLPNTPPINYPSQWEAEMPTIRISNGDTEDWTKLELIALRPQEFTGIKSFFDVVFSGAAKSAKTYDPVKRCWFIKSEYMEVLLKGLHAFLLDPKFTWINIEDERVAPISVESFEEFFTTPPPSSGSKNRTKEELVEAMADLVMKYAGQKKTEYHYKQYNLDDWKKLYRKLALALHPDRNNGDGSKMSELNMIWNDLQGRF
jgi:hypothetical protein